MADRAVFIGVDVAKSSLDVAASDSVKVRGFATDDEVIRQAVDCRGQILFFREVLHIQGSVRSRHKSVNTKPQAS